jgi:RHS repeat-associated protein
VSGFFKRFCLTSLACLASLCLSAADKSGVGPNAISLPKGPGAVEGLGESFQPHLNTGTASTALPLKLPPGTAGHSPVLNLEYEGGSANGPLGFGWMLPMPCIQRRSDKGIPTYGENVGFPRTDAFINEMREELVPLTNGFLFCKNEGAFVRYLQVSNYWGGTLPNGTRMEFGLTADGRVQDLANSNHVFAWLLQRETDTHGNVITWSYTNFPGSNDLNQKYLSGIAYGPGAPPWNNFHFVSFAYEDRPDWFEDCRSGFVVRTGKRLRQIIIGTQGPALTNHAAGDFNGDGVADYLDRKYVLDYLNYAGTNSHWSLLASVTEFGADGTNSLPPATYGYAVSDPPPTLSAAGQIIGASNEPPVVMDNPAVDFLDLNGDGLPDILATDPSGGFHTAYLNAGPEGSGSAAVINWRSGAPLDSVDGRATQFGLQQTAPIAHLADMDGDGLADLAVTAVDGTVFYFQNNGHSGWGARQDMTIQDTAPPSPFSNPDVRTADLDFDKRMDIIQSISTGSGADYRIWFNLGNRTYSAGLIVPQAAGFMLSASGVQIADLNGDRVPDIARITSSFVSITAGLGYGRFAAAISVPIPDLTLDDAQLSHASLIDINGDGLADLVIERAAPGELWYWLNLGNYSFSHRKIITGMPVAIGVNAATRWADLNGNGTVDLVYADSTATPRLQTVDIGQLINGGATPNLLVRSANGIGRVTTLTYQSSTTCALADAAAGHPWPDAMPNPVQVLSSSTTSDSLGHQYVTQFRYHDGYYDPVEKQFRGFASAEQIEVGDATAPTLVTRSFFDTGRTYEPMKGELLSQSVEQDDGGVFSVTTNLWTVPPVTLYAGTNGTNVVFAHPTGAIRLISELGHGTSRRLESESFFDSYGNQTTNADYGIVENGDRSAFDDERVITTEFALNTNLWIVRLPARQEVKDENGAVISRIENYYDDETFSGNNPGSVATGNLTLRRAWIDPVNAAAFVKVSRAKFDSYGNAIALLDPLFSAPGGTIDFTQGHSRQITYDSRFHAYPVNETIHVGLGTDPLVAQAAYDEGLATTLSSTDFNTNTTSYGYDSLGRLASVVKPYDTPGYPTVEYSYNLAVPVGTNGLVNYVETRRRDKSEVLSPKSEMYFFSREFVDGLGRKLMTKTEAEPAIGSVTPRVVVSKATLYNARQKPALVLNPCFAVSGGASLDELLGFENIEAPGWEGAFQLGSNLVNLTLSAAFMGSVAYDATLRAIAETNQDGTFRQTFYEPLLARSYDENQTDPTSPFFQNSMVRHADGLGRLIQVDEVTHLNDGGTRGGALHTWVTRYQYDLNNQLTTITDSLNNVKIINYDGLKRKTAMNDPDRGQKTYVYDDASNLVETRDAQNQLITYTYDGVNRLLTEDYHDGSPVPPWRSPQETSSVIYTYDTPIPNVPQGDNTLGTARNTRGALVCVRDFSGEEHNSHDAQGRIEYSVKRIPDPVFLSAYDHPSGTNFSVSVPLVSFRTSFEYDPLDRITRLVFPDNDEVRFTFNQRTLLERIPGGLNTNIISSISYLPSGQRRQVDYGNGVRVTSDYDARLRQTILDARHLNVGTRFIAFAYDLDPVSNLRAITDLRPGSALSATDSRRNSQTFDYDDLYRLTRVQYNSPNSPQSNGGEIDYRYDRIANLLSQTSNIPQSESGLSITQIGELDYGGAAGKTGRIGRSPADPPGPHALSSVQSPGSGVRSYQYDANGNMLTLDGRTNTWDFKDRLVACQSAGMRAEYLYDFSDRRIMKRVWPTNASSPVWEPATVLYVSPAFEVRDHEAATKYVFNAGTRVARVTGSLSNNPRIQRLRVYPGWNLCSLAVTAANAMSQFNSANPQLVRAAYRWSTADSSWVTVGANEGLDQGTVLWLYAVTNAVIAALGPYAEPINRLVPAGGGFLPSAGLEAWNLTNGLPSNLLAWLRSAPTGSDPWKIRFPADSGLTPSSTLPSWLAPGQALFVENDTGASIQLPEPALRIHYYLQDHLGSSSVITDGNGTLVEETAYYPSGVPRNSYEVGTSHEPYQFAQKERDAETGLLHFQARYLAGQLSRFISVDPKYSNLEALAGETGRDFLGQPQLHNLYAFAACNPLKYVDPDGLEVTWAENLRKNRQFQRALRIVQNSNEGQRILAALEHENIPAAAGQGKDPREGGHAAIRTELQGSERRGWHRVVTVSILIDIEKAQKEHMTDHELANVIHHELRHAEIHLGALEGEDLSIMERVERAEQRRSNMDKALDIYIRADIPTANGTGIQTSDARNHDFQVEIGLRLSQEEEDARRQAARENIERRREQIRARAHK